MSTRQIAMEYAPHGVRANVILPGCIETPMTYSTLPPELDRDEALRREGLQAPMLRVGQPEEVADVCAFLLSDQGVIRHRRHDHGRRRVDHPVLRVCRDRAGDGTMSPRLEGKRALITGASSGLGRGAALRFAVEGASVAVGGRDPGRVDRTVREITDAGGVAIPAVGDVSQPRQRRSRRTGRGSGLDGLDTRRQQRRDRCRRVVPGGRAGRSRTSTRSCASTCAARSWWPSTPIPHLLEAGGGSIVHMSSVCAITVWAGDCAYDMSKAGLNMLSDHISVEYGPRGIRSNTLMPGCIRTEMHESVMASLPNGREFEQELMGRHPIGRFGSVEEVAAARVFLCEDDHSFMTGANITIDGGYSRV